MNRKSRAVLIGYAVAVSLLCVLPASWGGLGRGDELIWTTFGTVDVPRWIVGIVAVTIIAGVAMALTWPCCERVGKDGSNDQ